MAKQLGVTVQVQGDNDNETLPNITGFAIKTIHRDNSATIPRTRQCQMPQRHAFLALTVYCCWASSCPSCLTLAFEGDAVLCPWRQAGPLQATTTTSSSLSSSSSSSSSNADDASSFLFLDKYHNERMLQEMTEFYASMVDPQRQRFYYSCKPAAQERLHRVHALRDLAAAWDATKILLHWKNVKHSTCHYPKEESLSLLRTAIERTIESYPTTPLVERQQRNISTGNNNNINNNNTDDDDAGVPCPQMLSLSSSDEQHPNLGHSALKILACVGAVQLNWMDHCHEKSNDNTTNCLDGLAQGILSLQRSDGAFYTEFRRNADDNENDIYRHMDFYPGEAMVALLELYTLSARCTGTTRLLHPSTQAKILSSLQHAFDFYETYYRQQAPATNFNVWQIQAFANLFHVCQDTNNKNRKIAKYVLAMSRDICLSRAWKYELVRGRSFYPNIQTLEIVCGLDALVDAITVATTTISKQDDDDDDKDMIGLLNQNIHNAVDFVQWSLDRIPVDAAVGRGGLGYGGVQVMEQRLDVTGHAMSALTKLAHVRNIGRLESTV